MSFLKSLYNRMNVNSSTLSGASDVVVVAHEDGTYLCSLFRIRFGKMNILKRASGRRTVSILVNGTPVDQKMRVGSDGEAYFLSKLFLEDGNEVSSPMIGLSPVSSMINLMDAGAVRQEEIENALKKDEKSDITIKWGSLLSFTNKTIREEMSRRQQLIRNMVIAPDENRPKELLPLQEGDGAEWSQTLSPSILRRKRFDYNLVMKKGQSLILQFCVYQHDLGFSAYFNEQDENTTKHTCIEIEPYKYVLSTHGKYGYVFTAPTDGSIRLSWDNSYSYFNKKHVTISMTIINEKVPKSVRIVYETRFGSMQLQSVREDGMATLNSTTIPSILLYAPIITLVAPSITIHQIADIEEGQIGSSEDEGLETENKFNVMDPEEGAIPAVVISLCKDQYRDEMSESELDSIILKNRVSFSDIVENSSLLEHPNVMFFCDRKPVSFEEAAEQIVEMAKEVDRLNVVSSTNSRDRKPLKSYRVSSDVLKTWPLVEGENTLTFTTDADKKCVVTCKLYLLQHDARVIISDVDGTVTKEDVMGHIMYAIHQDYTQKGIVKMYNHLDENGYVILYLTARAVGQMKDTRDYLEGIQQNGQHMPKGPIICSPNRTLASLIREVVRRKPQEFKIPVLRSIRDTFAMNASPFVGGFGNRPTDAESYICSGIDEKRIFIINTKGVIKYKAEDGSEISSSFEELERNCDQLFPPIATSERKNAVDIELKDGVEE